MAVDTAAKRYSALNVLSPWRGLNYFPTGAVPQAERQAVIYLYSGILAVAPVAVPNVVGETQAAATTDITNAGLALGTVTTQYSDTVAAGLVISQNPAAGTLVSLGSAVSIVVSLGPQPSVSEQPAGRRRVRHIYRIKVDGEQFEFATYEAAVAFLEKAKKAAAKLADEAIAKAVESGQPTDIPFFDLPAPKIEVSTRELRRAASDAKREILAIYKRVESEIEIAIAKKLAERDQENEDLIWFM